MRQIPSWLLLWGTCLALVLLAGCGSQRSPGAINPTPTVSAPTASPSPAERVTVTVAKAEYQKQETLRVTIHNQSSQMVSFPDHQTSCTVILLQAQKAQPRTAEQGQPGINPCLLKTATRLHVLAAGQQLVVPIPPPSNGWTTGRFLATLNYFLASAPAATVSSSVFTIGPVGSEAATGGGV